jgi:hypothetical protein
MVASSYLIAQAITMKVGCRAITAEILVTLATPNGWKKWSSKK